MVAIYRITMRHEIRITARQAFPQLVWIATGLHTWCGHRRFSIMTLILIVVLTRKDSALTAIKPAIFRSSSVLIVMSIDKAEWTTNIEENPVTPGTVWPATAVILTGGNDKGMAHLSSRPIEECSYFSVRPKGEVKTCFHSMTISTPKLTA